jgi:hypothetical protein
MTEFPFTPTCVECPVHDWVLNIAGRPFGINQWGNSDCSIYIGTRIGTIGVPATAVALAVLIIALLMVLLLVRYHARLLHI